jgi:hypothetical protein
VWLGDRPEPDATNSVGRVCPDAFGGWGETAHWTDNLLNFGSDGFLLVAVWGLLARWRRSAGQQRCQASWLLWGVIIALLLEVPTDILSGSGTVWTSVRMIGFPVLPAAAAVALLRYQLLDIDVVINRTLVYAGLTGGVLLRQRRLPGNRR